MKRLYAATLAAAMLVVVSTGVQLLAQAPQPAAVPASSASVAVKVTGTGVSSISPLACTFKAGPGSANQQVCQFSATTVPAGGSVTWALNGGPDASKFIMSATGMLSTGPADVPVSQVSAAGAPIPYVIFVQAAGQ
jgi:hypothetical protein